MTDIESSYSALPDALKRRMPSPKYLASVMKFRKPDLDLNRRRLESALSISDLRKIAKRRTPTGPFDYADGAAETETTMHLDREAYHKVRFVPRTLRDVSSIDLSTEILGKTSALPVGIAPTGFTRLMQSEGEYAGSLAAAQNGIPFALSTMATASVDQLERHVPDSRKWFQLYLSGNRDRDEALVDRAAKAGWDTLFVTVDCATGGRRLRDIRNGLTMPPSLTLKTIVDASYRPAWWFNFLTRSPLEFASLNNFHGTPSELVEANFNPNLTMDDLTWLRSFWKGNLVVKGIQNVPDAVSVMAAGADGVVLSNHGGRQLDRATLPLYLVPQVRSELGQDATIILDSGIMSGGDIIAGLAAGADFTLIGRAYLFGLMAGGLAGVNRTIEILRTEMEQCMKLIGAASISDLDPSLVTLASPEV